MQAELLALAAALAQRGEPFVLAMVVRREPYSSAQQGDMAIITADGAYHGWLGGNCTQPTVKREAKRALAEGKPRLVSLSPDPGRELRPGVLALPMTCHSGGSVDIYLEPMLPAPLLALFGSSPVVRALGRLGGAMGYTVATFEDPAAPEVRALRGPGPGPARRTLVAVVATMGANDEDSVAAALELAPSYLGVVASRRRYAELRESLLARGLAPAALDAIRNPAGLDLGARLPEELALSILAEVVQLRRAAAPAVEEPAGIEPAAAEPEALDPVCHMTVVIATARHRAEHEGQAYYFCNSKCREKFLAAPGRYLDAPAAASGAKR